VQVLYRLDGKQSSTSFEDLASAKKFQKLVDKFGPAKALETLGADPEFSATTRPRVDRARHRPPLKGDGVVEYRPTTWPGARLPHSMILHDNTIQPIHDLMLTDGLTLVTPDPRAWAEAVQELQRRIKIPMRLVVLRAPTPGDQQDLVEHLEVGDFGAILVRPDGHVAWRTTDGASEGHSMLVQCIEQNWRPFWR